MRRLGLLVGITLLGVVVGDGVAGPKVATLVYVKDVADTSYAYCSMRGSGGDPFGAPIPGTGRVETSGSSTTVTAETASDDPFTNVAAGDMLYLYTTQPPVRRRVATWVSADEITVDTALNTTGTTWGYYDTLCGADAGWLSVEDFTAITFVVDVVTLNATSIGWQVQCRVLGSNAVEVPSGAGTVTTATTTSFTLNVAETGWTECRMGLKVNTDGGVQSVSAYASRR